MDMNQISNVLKVKIAMIMALGGDNKKIDQQNEYDQLQSLLSSTSNNAEKDYIRGFMIEYENSKPQPQFPPSDKTDEDVQDLLDSYLGAKEKPTVDKPDPKKPDSPFYRPINDNPISGNPISGNPINATPINGKPHVPVGNPIGDNPVSGNPINDRPISVKPDAPVGKPINANPDVPTDQPVSENPDVPADLKGIDPERGCPASYRTFSNDVLRDMAQSIHKAVDGPGTDWEKLKNTVTQLTKENIVEVARMYANLYNGDNMFHMIVEDLGDSEQNEIVPMLIEDIQQRANDLGVGDDADYWATKTEDELGSIIDNDDGAIRRNLQNMYKVVFDKERDNRERLQQ